LNGLLSAGIHHLAMIVTNQVSQILTIFFSFFICFNYHYFVLKILADHLFNDVGKCLTFHCLCACAGNYHPPWFAAFSMTWNVLSGISFSLDYSMSLLLYWFSQN
jgi:hypothetical protein